MSTKSRDKTIRLQVDPKSQHADLYLIGTIGTDWWPETNNSAQRVLAELSSYTALTTITVHLSTMGGSFLDGLPIYNVLKQHPAKVTINIIGYAVSMGSVIMLAGDTINAAQNSIIMIHNAQGAEHGSASDLRKMAEILETHEHAIIPRYAERMGKTPADVQALLNAETWYSAEQALEIGLIDAITDPVDAAKTDRQQPTNAWAFAADTFKHPPHEFTARMEHQFRRDASWIGGIINRVVGTPPTLILPTDPDEVDIDMTEDELKAAITAAATAAVEANTAAMNTLIDTKLATLQAPPVEEEAPDAPDGLENELSAKLATAHAENAALKAKIATLDKKLADDTRTIPENIGAAGEWDFAY